MACNFPIRAWRGRTLTRNGKRPLVFNPTQGFTDLPLNIPCGKCDACLLERSRQWAIRCVHEASLYSRNCFITLTYSPENLPVGATLIKSDFQKFMKRLRKRFSGVDVVVVKGLDTYPIRYFQCGEYGDEGLRPHYHACLFNFDFDDRKLWRTNNGVKIYTSEVLNSVWGLGHSTVGDVTFESAAYVARYVMKKVTGDAAKAHYTRFDSRTGEFFEVIPEYVAMSLKPGIGKLWIDKYMSDVYPHGYVVVRGGHMCRPPKFYDMQYELVNPEGIEKIKDDRITHAFRQRFDNTYDRRLVKDAVLKGRIKSLKRSI